MRIFKFSLIMLALLATQHSATSQTVSGRSFITGFEMGTLAEGIAYGSGGSVQSAVVRSGSYAYHANPNQSNAYIAFQSRAAGGNLRQIFASARFYLYVAQLPVAGSVSIVKIGGAATLNPEVDLNADGSLTLADSWRPAIATSQNALSADGQWHRIEFDVGAGLHVYVDGALWASGTVATYSPGYSIAFGAGQSPTSINATADLYFDDVLVDGGSFSVTGFPGDGHAALLRPAGDPVVLNSWTGGAGATSNVYMAAKNAPPAGMPPTAESNTSQIKNPSHGTNLDYKPSIQSYTAAGVPATAVINAAMAICNDGQESSKGSTKSGGVWIDSNPGQVAGGYSFDYGDAAGAVTYFPSGWATHFGPVISNPAVSISGSPIVAVRKTTNSDGVDVDFLGVYIDYR